MTTAPIPDDDGRAGRRVVRGRRAYVSGNEAEEMACAAYAAEGWIVLGRRLRTAAGEVDAVAQKAGLLVFIEVKRRATLAEAAGALAPRQRRRLLEAGEILLGEHPDWGAAGVRFDVIVVDPSGAMRRITDAFRSEN
jgi:putative endonuclease